MANSGGTDPADRVAVDLVPGAQKSGASAVRIDAVIRIENLHGFAASVPLLAILALSAPGILRPLFSPYRAGRCGRARALEPLIEAGQEKRRPIRSCQSPGVLALGFFPFPRAPVFCFLWYPTETILRSSRVFGWT